MRKPAFSAALLLGISVAGCDSPKVRAAHRAEQREAMVERFGASADELCAAQRDVAAAWLNAGDEDRYRTTKLTADLTCNEAALKHIAAAG